MTVVLKKVTNFILLIPLTVILCVACAPQNSFMYDATPDTNSTNNSPYYTGSEGIFQFTIMSEEVRIDYVTSSDGKITVPKEIQNFVITEIGTYAFYQNHCTSVELPSTIRSIQSAAFYRCHNIKDITIPGETVSIDGNPFFRCSGLEDIHVQPSNTSYSDIDGVLYDSTGTTLIAYPEGKSETMYKIPEGVTKIADESFGYNSNLETVIIPKSVVEFPDYNLFETYEYILLIVAPGSDAEKYALKYGVPYCIESLAQ